MPRYNNTKVESHGFTFDSQAEYYRYLYLLAEEQAGVITDLDVHPAFVYRKGRKISGFTVRKRRYTADFSYIKDGVRVIEDVKGYISPEYRMRRDNFLIAFEDEFEVQKIWKFEEVT